MRRANWLVCGLGVLACSMVLPGCGSRSPDKPQLSPTESATQAIDEYDADGDGVISKKEAEAAPGLLAAFDKIDKDASGDVTQEEIENRIVYYKTSTSWVINGTCRVLYRGRPLMGADVVFEPESFLGDSFNVCSGVTDERGEVFVTAQGDAGAIPGIYLGFYRVRITKEKDNGDELIPAKYNTETTLGFEANNDVPDEASYSNTVFKLR